MNTNSHDPAMKQDSRSNEPHGGTVRQPVRMESLLDAVPPGPIHETAKLERVLAEHWSEFTGDDGGMDGYKLLNRMENVIWNPPTLTFQIERHGGTVMGSTRADLQEWTVDLEAMTAECEVIGYRQLWSRAPVFKAKPVAERVAGLIITGKKDDYLKWNGPDEVRVVVGKFLAEGSAVKQTLAGRRKRFRQELKAFMRGTGWEEVSAHRWCRYSRED